MLGTCSLTKACGAVEARLSPQEIAPRFSPRPEPHQAHPQTTPPAQLLQRQASMGGGSHVWGAYSGGREAVCLLVLSEDVRPSRAPEATRAYPHRRQTLSLLILP